MADEANSMSLLQEIEMLKMEVQTNIQRVMKNLHLMEQIHAKILELKEQEIYQLKHPDTQIESQHTERNTVTF
jgi:hypothetical protein